MVITLPRRAIARPTVVQDVCIPASSIKTFGTLNESDEKLVEQLRLSTVLGKMLYEGTTRVKAWRRGASCGSCSVIVPGGNVTGGVQVLTYIAFEVGGKGTYYMSWQAGFKWVCTTACCG